MELPRIALVLEYCDRGTLRSVLKAERGKISLERKKVMLLDISRGINYLHQKGIIHRDLKLENVLVDKGFNCKVSDFGMSKIKQDAKMTKLVGTSQYMSPEVTLANDYDEKGTQLQS